MPHYRCLQMGKNASLRATRRASRAEFSMPYYSQIRKRDIIIIFLSIFHYYLYTIGILATSLFISHHTPFAIMQMPLHARHAHAEILALSL